jgi:hypothetical protein
MMPSKVQVWKVFYAEMICCIWISRCRKSFDDKDPHFFEIKLQMIARVEYTLMILVEVIFL